MRKSSPIWVYIFLILGSNILQQINSAIVPPPWGDPNKNPCAALPGGWQLLYWAPLRKCFKIFQVGFPCPETMELSPIGKGVTGTGSTAECRCPPGTAQSALTSKCHTLFEKGPCELGQYFAPAPDPPGRSNIPKKRWGICKTPQQCIGGMIFWPQDNKCYTLHSRGPCGKGKLLTLGQDKITECRCEYSGELSQYYYPIGDTCHEHFTRGPCQGIGELFLPGGRCGCHSRLPHYHEDSDQCYEIGTIGPCPLGHVYVISENSVGKVVRATCQCKEGYALWRDGFCYRLFTRGPCNDGEFLVNATSCIKNPCEKGRLYFPDEKTCYRIGSQGPCSIQQVVVFDFTTRPSIEGISYNGVCGCSGIINNLDQTCTDQGVIENACDSTPGMVELNSECYKLYSRGPCGAGEWLEPHKLSSEHLKGARCQCKPGYTAYETEDGITGCHAPTVGLARYLNGKNHKSYVFGFRRVISMMEQAVF